jgi:nucleotide-binding universal stress UspA family protein
VTGGNSILAGIDLGSATENIVAYVSYFASKTGASARLLYVIDYHLTPPSYLSSYIEEERVREESEMAGWKLRLKSAGIETEYAVVLGRLHESFMRVIEETSPELLVIGYRSHLIRPSSSERLIKSLHLPMLVVRGGSAEHASIGSVDIRRILCPVDFSENARKAVSAAKRYAELFSAELRIVHIIPSHLVKEKGVLWKKLSASDRERFDATLTAEAKSKMDAFTRDIGLDAGGKIFEGNPGEMISSIAGDEMCDLIVIGARGLSNIAGTPVGGTTEAVLRSSPCPLLVVH